MAVRRLAEQQPPSFEFTPQNLEWAKAKIRDYPEGRQASAVIPILWRAQEQHAGWLPEPAIRLVADMLDMPYIRVFEVATFYTMFQLQPVGTVAHIGVCGTTPCMLRGSDDLIRICKERIAPHPFELSEDGRFSWEEVECAGACVNAPMVQIGPETYEDLTAESFNALLDALASGGRPEPGPQSARRGSEPLTGATTLTSPRKHVHPHEPEAAPDAAPDANVSPESPAAAGGNVARPDPRDRTDVEATRTSDAAPRKPSPVAPEPETNGRAASAPDEPEKQKSAQASGEMPDDRAVKNGKSAAASAEHGAEAKRTETGAAGSGTDRTVETVPADEPTEAEEAQADRAAPAGEYAQEPLEDEAARTGAPDDDTARTGAPDDDTARMGAPEDDTARTGAPEDDTARTGVPEDDTARTGAPEAAPAAAQSGPTPPDSVAAERADAAGRRPQAFHREEVESRDELQRISGIGRVLEKTLHGLGIFRFSQIAAWDQSNKDWVNAYLAFKGRIDRERWVEQAQEIVNEERDGSH